MILEAHAKINLSLDITGKRDNGYHDLDTIMQTISLHDTVEVVKNRTGDIHITCTKISIPTDESNIAYKAALLFLEQFDIIDMGVNIHIVKNIPVEAGLGGGSADAAAVLKAMKEIFKPETTEKEILKLALKLGADVPFCYITGIKRCKGIGEVMSYVPPLPNCSIVVCKPPVGVSTKEAYIASDKFPDDNYFGTAPLLSALRKGNLLDICANISNRFDDILLVPEVTIIKSFMLDNGALTASMSGSGSAVFGIFEHKHEAEFCAECISHLGQVFICDLWKDETNK